MENDNNNLNNSNQDDKLNENANEFFNKHQDEAEKILNDPDKLEKFLEEIEKKLRNMPNIDNLLTKNPKIIETISKILQTLNIGEVLAKIPLVILLIKSYTKKEYTEIPYRSIIVIIIALIYLLSPIDIIPDVIPFAGYIDDVAVLGLALKFVGEDLEKYREWREKRKTR